MEFINWNAVLKLRNNSNEIYEIAATKLGHEDSLWRFVVIWFYAMKFVMTKIEFFVEFDVEILLIFWEFMEIIEINFINWMKFWESCQNFEKIIKILRKFSKFA